MEKTALLEMVGRNSGIGNVNFDYSGPPVVVSNSMVLDLVTQFGMQNAVYAFLKLRGISPFKNDIEKEVVTKRFRSRIRQLRRAADNFRGRPDELTAYLDNEFSSEEFNEFNASEAAASESAGDNTQPVKSEAAGSSEDRQNRDNGAGTVNDKDDPDDDMGKLVIDEDISTSSAVSPTKFQTPINETINFVISRMKTTAVTGAKKADFELKSPPPAKATNKTADSGVSPVASTSQTDSFAETLATKATEGELPIESSAERRHRETIDDVVSSVIARIRNKEPLDALFGGSSSLSANFIGSGASAKGRKTRNVFVKPLNQLATVAASSSNTLVDNSTGTVVTFPTPSEQIQMASQLGGSIMPDQVTILSNFTEIIRSSTSSHQTAAPQLTPVTKIIGQGNRVDLGMLPQHIQQQHFQQQQQHITQLPAGSTIQFPGFSLPLTTATAGGIPIGISPQGTITLPNNISVQSLLQSLQQPNKKMIQLAEVQLQNQPTQSIQLQIQPNLQKASIQQILQAQQQSQQILLDSNSQDVGSNSTGMSNGQPTLYTSTLSVAQSSSGSVAPAKAPAKKRPYMKRKGIIAAAESEADAKHALKSETTSKSAAATSEPTVKSTAATTTAVGSESSSLKGIPKKTITPKLPSEYLSPEKKSVSKKEAFDESDSDQKSPQLKRSNLKKGASKIEPTSPKQTTLKTTAIKDEENKKSAKTDTSNAKTTKTSQKSLEKDLEKIEELESQLAKCQRQLNSEKNKTSAQKKRIEKLQADLEKNADAIQLVQIDLACQKTDNNNLTAENISLKAELQKLRNKESKTNKTTDSTVTCKPSPKKAKEHPSTSKADKKQVKAGTKRRSAPAGPSKEEQEEIDNSLLFDKTQEFGRRQSKRICVARKNFLYGAF